MSIPDVLIKAIEADSKIYTNWLNSFEYALNNGGLLIGPSASPPYPVWPRDYDNFHYPMGMRKLLSLGFSGIRDTALKNSAKFNGNEKKYLQLIADVYSEICGIVNNFSCRPLSERAPVTFREACQLYWFAVLFRIGTSCVGRIDQHLYPFYKRDLEHNVIKASDAKAIISELLDKFEERGGGKGDTLQNITLAGLNSEGVDQTNELSYLILELCLEKKHIEPKINVRLNSRSAEQLLNLVSELQLSGTGICTIYNDEVIIDGLLKYGRPVEIASDYCADGCTEVILDGHGETAFRYVDCVKAVEHSIFNGGENVPEKKRLQYYMGSQDYIEIKPPVREILYTGEFEKMRSYEDFYNAYLAQLKHQVDCALREGYNSDRSPMRLFVAATLPGVIENACEPYTNDSCYHSYGLFIGSLGTAVNSLMAVKKLVYDEKKIEKSELLGALKDNFSGHAKIRQICKSVPKYGNDIDEVDNIAVDIARRFCGWVCEYKERTNKPILPGLYNHLFHHTAYYVGATPDGRQFGDAVGEHLSPTPGSTSKGPTAIINSLCKVNTGESIYGSTLHMNIPMVSLSGTEKPQSILKYLTKTFCIKRGSVMNVNVLSTEVLLDAQKNPDKYSDLVVRVWGFSHYFTQLSKEMQEHVIARSGEL